MATKAEQTAFSDFFVLELQPFSIQLKLSLAGNPHHAETKSVEHQEVHRID